MPFADIAKTAMKGQASGMRGLLSFVVLGILSGTAVAADMAPKPKPAWVVEYAEKFCALVRMPDAGRPGIVIRARPLSPYFELLILTPLGARQKEQFGPMIFNFGDGPPVDGFTMWSGDLPERGVRVIQTSMPAEQLDQAEKFGAFRASSNGKFDLTVPLPAMAKARKALETCSDDLLKSWNIVRTWSVAPKEVRDVRTLFNESDYPSSMMDAGRQAKVIALLEVAPNGSVASCKAQELEGDRMFEIATCKILSKRAKFVPARDSSGRAVRSYYLSPPVRFVLAG